MKPLHLALFICIMLNAIGQQRIEFENWEFREVGSDIWYPATVPGGIHYNLFQNGLIPDPYIENNEAAVQWVETKDWEFRAAVEISKKEPESGDFKLVAEGLDTYATLYWDGQEFGTHANSFLPYSKGFRSVPEIETEQIASSDPTGDDRPILSSGKHEIRIAFRSPLNENSEKVESYPHRLPSGNESVDLQVSNFSRKPTYEFGWDWGPRLVGCGIWRNIFLERKPEFELTDLQVTCENVADTLASLRLTGLINGIQFPYTEDSGMSLPFFEAKHYELKILGKSHAFYQVSEGHFKFDKEFVIENPKLWWPNGWGEPYMYETDIELWKDGELLSSKPLKFGIRTVELVNQPDERGTSYYFVVNGKPIYMKGANYIPQHLDPSLVTNQQYEHLIGMAKDANMNMLRVWGGGIYEKDIFYDLCDKNGIMVWQDFMFANSLYPQDEAFLENCEAEVRYQTRRLRKHPCIALFCGNNEINVAWHNWGWQKQFGYSPKDSVDIYKSYQDQFEERMPKIVSAYSPEIDYVPTSPLSNWGTPENFNHSSMHYWGVWHGREPFQNYWTNVPRFMAEYGFQSFPNYDLLNQFVADSSMYLESDVMTARQKSYIGNGMITQHMERWFEPATDFRDYIEKSQKTQAIGMQMAIMAHRLGQPHCMGTLFWQLNDCWPGPSWSVINYDGTPKVAYETVKIWYAPVVVVPQLDKRGRLSVHLCADGSVDFEGDLVITVGDKTKTISVSTLEDNSNWHKTSLKQKSKNGEIHLQLIKDGQVVWEGFVDPRML